MVKFLWCLRLIGLGIFLAVCGPAHASDPVRFYFGDWGQVASSAGACGKCSISIRRSGGVVTVTANNGWSADVAFVAGDPDSLQGRGRWSRSFSGAGASSAFSIVLVTVRDELHMVMRMEDAASRPRLVQAVFRKNWSGI